MEFPVPENIGPTRRSIGERHRILIIGTAVCSMIPAGLLVGPFIGNPQLALGATFLTSYALVVVIVAVLRRRFLRKAALGDWVLVRTTHSLPKKAARRVHELSSVGFTATEIAVVANETGDIFTRPIAILKRMHGDQSAIATSFGVQVFTLLHNGRWLVTSDTKVVNHPMVIVQPASETLDAVEVHERGLDVLRRHGILPAQQPPASSGVLQLERFEQDTLRGTPVPTTAIPGSAPLLQHGMLLTDDLVRAWPEVVSADAPTER